MIIWCIQVVVGNKNVKFTNLTLERQQPVTRLCPSHCRCKAQASVGSHGKNEPQQYLVTSSDYYYYNNYYYYYYYYYSNYYCYCYSYNYYYY
eukprot:gene8367-biopygen722